VTSLQDIEDAIFAATRAVVGDAQLGTSALVDAIRDRSARYTSDRTKLAKPASPKADLAARAVFFTIADAPKIAIPIAELASRDAIPTARPLRVVDLGAGCGAMSLGMIAALDVPMAITAIDRDREALGIATTVDERASDERASDERASDERASDERSVHDPRRRCDEREPACVRHRRDRNLAQRATRRCGETGARRARTRGGR
jgi:hypothetical protein